MEYQFENKMPEKVPKALKMAWTYLRKDLDDARRHYETSVKNGRKGGRPKKKEPENNPEETEENLKKGTSTTTSTSTTTTTTTSTSMSTSTDTGSAPAEAAGVCSEKNSFGEFGWVKLTAQQYDKLMDQWGYDELHRCITYVDEAAQSTGNRNRWKDWYLIIRRCHENRWYEARRSPPKEEIPKGASGTLGEAELEAIARVLSE